VIVVDLRYCGLTVLELGAVDGRPALDQLKVLELRGNAIAVLPTTIRGLTSLERIMIEMNRVKALPDEICTLSKLAFLYIAYNELTALPECIGELPIVDLWLRGNNVSELPQSFCEIKTGIAGHLDASGLTKLPDCIGRVRFNDLFLQGNELTELPESMAAIFSRRPGPLEVAHNRLTALPSWLASTPNITAINAEGNKITRLPTALPKNLRSLRLGGNPLLFGVSHIGDHGIKALIQTLGTLHNQTLLNTFSIAFASSVVDGRDTRYLVESMPGMSKGIARCPSSLDPNANMVSCPFTIQTAGFPQIDYRSTGGLGLHFCRNTTEGCGCENATSPYPPSCIPLVDNNDGTYSSSIDGGGIAEKYTTFRFFQMLDQLDPAMQEFVVGAWADGTECIGGRANSVFQSSGGNCFEDVVFELDCSAHGPFASVVESVKTRSSGPLLDSCTPGSGEMCPSGVACPACEKPPCICPASAVANAVSCVCPAGWSQLHHSTPGRWQCVPAADNAVDKEMPDWGINIIVVCVLVAVSSLGFAVWGAKSALASATPAFPAEFAPPRVTQGAGLREGLVNME
jgi:hypothetical protein